MDTVVRAFYIVVGMLHPTRGIGAQLTAHGRRPTLAAVRPLRNFHPNQPTKTFLANISPNPSMTPFMNGSSKLIAREDSMRDSRVRRLIVPSKMEGRVDGGGLAALASVVLRGGEGGYSTGKESRRCDEDCEPDGPESERDG